MALWEKYFRVLSRKEDLMDSDWRK